MNMRSIQCSVQVYTSQSPYDLGLSGFEKALASVNKGDEGK